ncbi:hypothetical protein A0H76_266 [Hepatospora eriocheir]|uniref:Uncharacterized protein n=1 Tax=Hepatospora eriocheir TaxID=1081669 RepID=A0A1X0QD75_9MICR|nr:hypothetical protein A0H76_266 [Hepatospora eriocheir]
MKNKIFFYLNSIVKNFKKIFFKKEDIENGKYNKFMKIFILYIFNTNLEKNTSYKRVGNIQIF